MKKIAFIIFSILILTGCDDFLSFDPLLDKTSTTYPKTEAEVKQLIAGIYSTMSDEIREGDMSFFLVNETASDQKLGGGGVNDLKTQAYEAFAYSDADMLGHNWETTYEGIHRANYTLEKLAELEEGILTEELYNQYSGEAYFLRAYFYSRLATIYGEVPLKLTTEEVNLPAAKIDEIYAQIGADLMTAIDKLPSKPYSDIEQGRATKWAAEALLGRVWLFYTGFYTKTDMPNANGGAISKADVIDALEDLVTNSGHKLVDDFHELWAYTNSLTAPDYQYIQDYMADTGKSVLYASDNGARNPEAIFAQQFSNFAQHGTSKGYSNAIMLFFALRGLQDLENTFPFAGGWGQANSVPKHIVDEWEADEPGDIRLWASVIDIHEELVKDRELNDDGEPKAYQTGQWDFVLESNFWGKKHNGVSVKAQDGSYKHTYGVLMYGTPNDAQLSHTDELIYIRYADVLLMLAELKEEASYINEVRARVGLADIPTYTLEALQKERKHELAFEAIRWNDMRRWGEEYCTAALEKQVGNPVINFNKPAVYDKGNPIPKGGYTARYKETKGFYPIPQSQINLSEGLLQQVAGYRDGQGFYSGFGD